MALDLYVGPISRYLRGDWKNLGQQAAEAAGIPYKVMGGPPKPSGLLGRWQADRAYNAWRKSVGDRLQGNLWNDDPAQNYFTHRPGWEGLAALMAIYAHRQFPDFPMPIGPVSPDALEADPAVSAQAERSNDAELLGGCRVWLPGAFTAAFEHPFPSGAPVKFGSIGELNKVLDRACEAWPVSRTEVELLALDQPGPEDSWEDAGLYGLSVYCQMATLAQKHGLPMVLDF